ncbi:MAG: hypothetical protein CME22_07445 [Gemmatimonadetes bacterium]|nr:hypothetical protein [Gemmatimonadota bacterium]
MTRYRLRRIFLLLLMGHATACATASVSWQAPRLTDSPDSDVSFADYIEIEQPEQVRITTEDRTQYLLYKPSVEGDEIVSSVGEVRSVPIADIVKLEVMAINGAKALAKTFAYILAVPFVGLAILIAAYGM